MHAGWQLPLTALPANFAMLGVKRDVNQAAIWASLMTPGTLEDYLKTIEGKLFSNYWSDVEVRQADDLVKKTP
jgi:hypothetical protein